MQQVIIEFFLRGRILIGNKKNLFQKALKELSRHLSLIIIVIGAISYLLSNIILKERLDENNYGQYSIIITYYSLVFLYGMLGFEQVFLRYTFQVKEGVLLTSKLQVAIFFTTSIITSLMAIFIFKKVYFEIQIPTILLFFSTFSMVFSMYFFNIFRINNQFVFSQLIVNFWKFFLLFFSIIFYLNDSISFNNLILVFSSCIILVIVFVLLYYIKKIQLDFDSNIKDKEMFLAWSYFFISITSFSILTFGDRFLIERKIGTEVFGNYFYLTNFFLAPFSILQNYIGFKQLIFYKTNFSPSYFRTFNRKIIFSGIMASLFLILSSLAIDYINILNFKFNNFIILILLLLALGVVRLYSSAVSSAFEALTNNTTLRDYNIYSIIITIIITLFVVYFVRSIELILFCFILMWYSRTFIQKKLLLKQHKKISNVN